MINDFSDLQKEEIGKYIEKVRQEEKGELGECFCKGLYEDEEFVATADEWVRWYEFEEHMTRLSKKFPKILFIVKVEYENQVDDFGDIEKFYFCDGKSSSIKGRKMVVWENDFAPEKMKDKGLKKKEYD